MEIRKSDVEFGRLSHRSNRTVKLRLQSWFGAAILIGILYSVIGVTFALPMSHMRFWRLAAWVVSAIVFATQISYEQLRLRTAPLRTALHAAMAVAVGGFGLAVAANLHELWLASHYRRSMAVALVAWPLITALPAFVVGLTAAYLLSRMRRLMRPDSITNDVVLKPVGSPRLRR